MKAIEKDEMIFIDNETQKDIKSNILMYNAGIKMANVLLKYYNPKNVLLVLGSGGNAGDALVLGNDLIQKNINVDAYIITEIKNKDSMYYLNLFKGNIIKDINFDSYDLIIDGIFGVGLNRYLDKLYVDIINKINNSNKIIVSLDIPSGIDANNGISYNAFIKSNLCITVEYIKTGMLLDDGLDSYEKVEVINVGMIKPNRLIDIINIYDFKNIFPKRLNNSNKGTYKKASIIAGSTIYPGASLISYNSLLSFKMGVGFSNLFVPKELYEIYALRHPEIIVNKIESIDGHIKYSKDDLDLIMKRSDSISIGMGMDISIDLYESIKYLLNNYDKRLIIDADGINSLAKYGLDILKNKKCEVILTPHLKEFSRLLNIDVFNLKKDIINISLNFSKEYNVILILKSASTIITDGINISISNNGCSALAKAGSGDSLSGILTGLMAYLNYDIYKISTLAVFMHSYAAKLATKDMPEEALTISEITNYIPKVIEEIKKI